MRPENNLSVAVLRFPVAVLTSDGRPDCVPVILTKDQLRAAGIVGQSSKELVTRICSRHGYKVLEIMPPIRRTLCFSMDEAWGRGSIEWQKQKNTSICA